MPGPNTTANGTRNSRPHAAATLPKWWCQKIGASSGMMAMDSKIPAKGMPHHSGNVLPSISAAMARLGNAASAARISQRKGFMGLSPIFVGTTGSAHAAPPKQAAQVAPLFPRRENNSQEAAVSPAWRTQPQSVGEVSPDRRHSPNHRRCCKLFVRKPVHAPQPAAACRSFTCKASSTSRKESGTGTGRRVVRST